MTRPSHRRAALIASLATLAAAVTVAPVLAESPARVLEQLAPATRPATRPAATQPASAVDQLILDLGNEDFARREMAAEQLRKMGKDALPALKRAAESDDPSTKSYADAILAKIDADRAAAERAARPRTRDELVLQRRLARPGFVGPMIVPGQRIVIHNRNVRNSSVSVRITNGVKEITAKEDDRTITIREDGAGIAMSITEPKDGKPVTTDYKAKDAEELKKEHPEAFKDYERFSGRGGVGEVQVDLGIGGGVGGVGLIGPVLPPMPIVPDVRLDIEQMRLQMQQQMEEIQRMRQEHLDRHREILERALRRSGIPEAERQRFLENLDRAGARAGAGAGPATRPVE